MENVIYWGFKMSVVNYIKQYRPGTTDEEMQEIKYGIDAIKMNIGKMLVFSILGMLFHVLPYMIAIFVFYGILRMFAYGVHAKTKLDCYIVSLLVIFPNIFMSINFKINIYERLVIFITSFILLAKYAPADTEERPLVNRRKRRILKITSLVISIIFFIISITIMRNSVIGNIIIFSILTESLAISPITYKLFKRRYMNHETYIDGKK